MQTLLSFRMAFVDLNRFEHRGRRLLRLEILSNIQFFIVHYLFKTFTPFFLLASLQSFIVGYKCFEIDLNDENCKLAFLPFQFISIQPINSKVYMMKI